MVTLADFLRHVLTSAVVMGLGLGAVTYSRFRYDTAHRSFVRFVWWYVGLVALIAILSRMSTVSNIKCPKDPTQVCRFNDTVPAMGTIAFIYTVTALIRARTMYRRR